MAKQRACATSTSVHDKYIPFGWVRSADRRDDVMNDREQKQQQILL